MQWIPALAAAALCGISLVVGSWITPKNGPRSARITVSVLLVVFCVVLVGDVLLHGVKGLPG
jgi:hypothetical protein